jgi:GTP-binding protein
MIKDYLEKRKNLLTVFVLVDIRLDPQPIDLRFIDWVGEKQIPLMILFTKADKLSKQQILSSVEQFKKALLNNWDELPQMIITSAEKKTGKEDVLDFIEKINKDFVRR